MVCKKSLYCLKNGPCATYQLRKQIWEDNIRFRESLRNINQSDHYWSFQITNNDFSDFDEPYFSKKRNVPHHKFRNCYDCASVTHELSSETVKKCTCDKSKPPRTYIEAKDLKDDYPETKVVSAVRPSKHCQTQPFSLGAPNQRFNSSLNHSRANKNVSEYCHRYRNTLSSAQLLPSTKVKFPSQSTLVQQKKNVNLKRYPSMDVISGNKNYLPSTVHNSQFDKNDAHYDEKKLNDIKLKNNILRNKEIKLSPWLSGTPLSRTTRKMLSKDKQIPFTSFGCNNSNDIVGCKKTHNVYASTKEIFPNALSAKQQREEMILNCLKKEKLFRNSVLQDGATKNDQPQQLVGYRQTQRQLQKRKLHAVKKQAEEDWLAIDKQLVSYF